MGGGPPLTMFICLHVPQKELARLINRCEGLSSQEICFFIHYTCGWCKTDFCIEVCEYGTSLALIITKWFNIGAGLSPNDPHWRRHAKLSERVHTGSVRPRTCHEKTSARVYFENASPRSSEELRSCNLSYLTDDRYKKAMYRNWIVTLWYIPRKSSWWF
jgi:hypothetical protein